jgi:hypothetical protein
LMSAIDFFCCCYIKGRKTVESTINILLSFKEFPSFDIEIDFCPEFF